MELKARIKKKKGLKMTKIDAREKFWEIYKEEELIKMFELSLEALKPKLGKYDMYNHFKNLCSEECVHGKFWNVNREIDNWKSELREVDESGELYTTLKKMVLAYWIAQITIKLDRKQWYVWDYINICREELSKYMDFYELLDSARKVDEDKSILINFLKENWNEDIRFEIEGIKHIIDYEDTRLNQRRNLEYQLQRKVYSYNYDLEMSDLWQ